MQNNWKSVWDMKGQAAQADEDRLEWALRLDGYDSPTAHGMSAEAMVDLARSWCRHNSVRPTDSIYELGCGAGAFLAALERSGHGGPLAGSDYSSSLVDAGQRLFPDISIAVSDAASIPVSPVFDHVTAVGVFLYFPDLEYARVVVERMITKAGKTVSLLDLPDRAREAECEAYRRGEFSPAEYEERYEGLKHLYFDRTWCIEAFDEAGWSVSLREQELDGYGNAPYRFNLFARRLTTSDE